MARAKFYQLKAWAEPNRLRWPLLCFAFVYYIVHYA